MSRAAPAGRTRWAGGVLALAGGFAAVGCVAAALDVEVTDGWTQATRWAWVLAAAVLALLPGAVWWRLVPAHRGWAAPFAVVVVAAWAAVLLPVVR